MALIKACKNLPDDADSDAVVEQYTKTTCRGTTKNNGYFSRAF